MATPMTLLAQHPEHILADLALHKDRLAQSTNALARLFRRNVALIGLRALDEAIAIDFEALFNSSFRLELVTHHPHELQLMGKRKENGRARG